MARRGGRRKRLRPRRGIRPASTHLGGYLPRMRKRSEPSMEPVVPSSARKKAIYEERRRGKTRRVASARSKDARRRPATNILTTCSCARFIMAQQSRKLTHAERVVPTRMTSGGLSFLRCGRTRHGEKRGSGEEWTRSRTWQ